MGAFELGAPDLASAIFWARVSYTFVLVAGVAWLCFTLDFSGSKWWRKPLNLALISVLPLTVAVITWFTRLNDTLWAEMMEDVTTLGASGIWSPVPWYLISTLYQYALYIAGIVILGRLNLRKPKIYRKQVALLITGTGVTILGTILYFAGIIPVTQSLGDVVYISISALIFAVTFIRYRFMDILPVAYRRLIQDIPEGIIVLDPSSHIVEINSRAQDIFRRLNCRLQLKSLQKVCPELYNAVSAQPDGSHIEMVFNIAKEPLYLNVGLVVLYEKNQEMVGKLLVLRDISELKVAQQKLETLYAQECTLRGSLEEEIQKRSRYSRAIVHELRTPLTSILASTELLQEQVKDGIQVALVNNIQRSSVNLEQRVNELFELARGELGLITLESRPLEMTQVIREIAAELNPVVEEKGLYLVLALPSHCPSIVGDKSRLRQILTNLIGNSIKFTCQGGIRVGLQVQPDCLEIRVADSGCGIEPEKMQQLFNPYRRDLSELSSASGLGIGLALCKILVELHQGQIGAESEPGNGTSVFFTLPYSHSGEST
jgi:signal transduction histidine kinase